ncbi:caspase family protein [Bacillus haynesii]|uniref:caspase family protein n=3 Tax=Bacillus haynesii TaxID=1925021 RepID=UPI00227E8261|nr:caspase family protein [Bacillus haynesii]MCY9277527.1 caspase family protein [Bacillus haynesii]
MNSIKAISIGVSEYFLEGATDLPFCQNDLSVIKHTLANRLKIERNNIFSLGESGTVKKDTLIQSLFHLKDIVSDSDTLIFYFSGHGTTISENHYLVCSDGLISTQEIIEYLEEINSKNKLILLDCCYAGNFSISHTVQFRIEEAISEFSGKGYAVFASSSASQVSGFHSEKPISLFTNFLCEAILDTHIVKKGKISLYDIQKLTSFYLNIWNKKNPERKQTPIFRSNMGGTIYFEVEDYTPYYKNQVYLECDQYTIYEVSPVHIGAIKRYSAKVILKDVLDFDELAVLALEIVDFIKKIEIYSNEISQKKFTGLPVNIVWLYFGRDEDDMVNSNFICHTTWVDKSQDKNLWYRINGEDNFIIKNVHFTIHSYYEQLKSFISENTGDKNSVTSEIKSLLTDILPFAEKAIKLYQDYKNDDLTEDELFDQFQPLIPEIERSYLLSTDLGLASNEIYDWKLACACLFSTIHDFTLFYNKQYKLQRDKKNRIACMDMTIKHYYEDLEKVKKLEKDILES